MGSTRSPIFGAVEAGGTKFVCAVGRGDGEVVETCTVPTEAPEVTTARCIAWLGAAASRNGTLEAIGIASFGPIRLDGSLGQRGRILDTPKRAWRGTDIVAPFTSAFDCPVGLDTDVNAAAFAEHRQGAARGHDDVAYITIGTGIGVGLIVAGRRVHGLLHPEAGHIMPRRHPDDLTFPGTCPTHGDCLEGLAAGTALLARCGGTVDLLSDDDPIWQIEAFYIAQLCATIALLASPRRIVLGGGIMQRSHLLPSIRDAVRVQFNGYSGVPEFDHDIDRFIVPPGLGAEAGVIGALLLAEEAWRDRKGRSPDPK